MKRLIIIFIIIYLAISSSYAKSESDYDIDKALEICSTKNFMTTGMNNCIFDGIDAWNNEIIKYTGKIKDILDKNQIELFDSARASWEKYYNAEKTFLYKTIYEKEGDIHTTFALNGLYELTKQRALNLKQYLFNLSE